MSADQLSSKIVVKFWQDGKLIDTPVLIRKDKEEVEKTMARYASSGYNIFNVQGRALNPSGCYTEAVGNKTQTIVLSKTAEVDRRMIAAIDKWLRSGKKVALKRKRDRAAG